MNTANTMATRLLASKYFLPAVLFSACSART